LRAPRPNFFRTADRAPVGFPGLGKPDDV
jgi:hypothetical protein